MSGASPPFEVVPATVSDAGKFVQDTARNLVAAIHTGDTEVQGLMTTWKGNAADAYLEGWEETKKGALKVLEALSVMAELLGVTAVRFTEIDDRRATGITGITRSLNLP
jgi:WXG100 family type VII secretion target